MSGILIVRNNKSDQELIKAEKEVSMNVMTVPNSVHILNDPNIFIRDFGASNHSTQYGDGIINCTKGNSGDAVMVGSGSVINANVVGDLPGTICDKHGTGLTDGIIQEIAHCPNMRCNVFSVTKLLLAGWKLGGNQDAIWLDKGNKNIMFNIKL